jgi:LuxR family maltose regulon positive regulatory protein
MAGASLSGRESETIRLLAAGLSIKEIAAMMGLSPKTVNLHVKNLCDKLGATSYVDAVNKARARGLA